MESKIVIATLAFAAGAGFGFLVGYSMNKNEADTRMQEAVDAYKQYTQKSEDPEPEKTQGEEIVEKPSIIDLVKPAKFAKPDGTPGINYTQYNKDVQAKMEAESPSDDDPDDISEEEELDESNYEETYEERLERESEEYIEHAETYRKEHAGKIELMREDEWDTDFPENEYEHADLYYFTENDTLTDEDGHVLAEEEFIGPKPRQVGWMRSPDNCIYIRNHPKETEYRVFKENCASSDWF